MSESNGMLIRTPQIQDVIRGQQLTAVFQPIVRLGEIADPFGFEALARLETDSVLKNPEILFEYARRTSKLEDLHFEMFNRAMRSSLDLVRGKRLFLNVHPQVLSAGNDLVASLETSTEASGIEMKQIVLEITEQGSIGDVEAAVDTVNRLRAMGVEFAFDDVGIAHSHLSLIDRIKPSFLKVSQHFGTDFEKDPTKVKLVRNILSLAGDFGAELILEGIERSETALAAKELGIGFGQGYFFSRPYPADHFETQRAGSRRVAPGSQLSTTMYF